MSARSQERDGLGPRLYLNAADVSDLLDVPSAIDLMRRTLSDYALGRLEQLHRRELVPAAGGGALGMMPAYQHAQVNGSDPTYAAKVVCVVHRPGDGPSHHGLCLLFSGETGELIAMLDAGAVTAGRTAAVTAVATDVLARPEAATVGVLGTGHQALPHVEALASVRQLTDVRIWGRTASAAERTAQRARAMGVPARAVAESKDAVSGSDVIVTLTPARSPIIERAWVAPGAHINAVGASTRHGVEVDPQTVAAARVFADDLEAARNDAGDLLHAAAYSTFDLDQIVGTIGDVMVGSVPGRTSPDDITLFKSVGLAVEDLAVARLLNARARAADRGTFVPA